MVHGVTTDKCLVENLKIANKAQSSGKSNMQKVISDLSRAGLQLSSDTTHFVPLQSL
mgnify:CR=1 FL=1